MEDRFRRPLPDGFRLIETLGWRPGAGCANLAGHLARLKRSARLLGVPYDRAAVAAALGAARGVRTLRLRLTLGLDGVPEVTAAPFEPGPPVWRLRVAEARLDPDDPWLGVKSSERALYDAARAALPDDIDEMLFLNRRAEVCEGTIFNVFVRSGGVLLTPPLASGCLPGVLRAIMLRRGQAREAVLRLKDLRRGELFVGNSLRGLHPAQLA